MVQVHARRRCSVGFTLVELLVVVSIIALLIAILLPSLQKAREQAKKVVCQSRMRGCTTAAFTYQADWGKFPPSLSNFADSPVPAVKAKRLLPGMDWLGIGDQAGTYVPGNPSDPNSGVPKGFAQCPTLGKLWPYANNEELYICPKDTLGPSENTPAGGGGNGKFSFTQFSTMGLRPIERIPSRVVIRTGMSSTTKWRLPNQPLASVPLFVEEWEFKGINAVSPGAGAEPHMDGNFNYDTDKVGVRHGPFEKRPGIKPGVTTGAVSSFRQGSAQIGFADCHVEDVPVNFGFTEREIKPFSEAGRGLKGIPYTASGLLYYYGLEYDPIKLTR